MNEVRPATPGERAAVGHALSLAFEDDPVMAWLFPDDASRARRLRSFYTVLLPWLEAQGSIETDAGCHGGAVWAAPSAKEPGGLPALWFGLRMALTLREVTARANALGQTTRPHRPREPHAYLAILGTQPSHQGRGLGRDLIAPGLARCDRDGTLAYLESSKRENIPFYERQGFEVVEELTLPDGPSLWGMLRAPR